MNIGMGIMFNDKIVFGSVNLLFVGLVIDLDGVKINMSSFDFISLNYVVCWFIFLEWMLIFKLIFLNINIYIYNIILRFFLKLYVKFFL